MSQSRAERKFRRQIDLLVKSPTVFKPEVLNHLASLAREAGDTSKAIAYLTSAAKLQPKHPETWLKIGMLNMEQEDFETSVDAYRHLASLVPDDPDSFVFLGDALQSSNNAAEAIPAYQKALTLFPDHPCAWTNLAMAFLQEGQWHDALNAAERQISLQPGHTGSIALKCIALQELKLDGAWKEIVDFDRLIGSFDISPKPEGYPDLLAFNRDLAAYCKAHQSLTYEPKANTTTLGWQTSDISNDGEPVIDALLAEIEVCVQQYIQSHPVDRDHPFLAQRPTQWNYYLWGTVLKSEGHQASHLHRDGWLSGVYYAELPSSIVSDANSDTNDGWIEFGIPQAYPKSKAIPETRTFEPVEGRLYLFPSYFYHRTIPFDSDTARVSLAFDLMPQH